MIELGNWCNRDGLPALGFTHRRSRVSAVVAGASLRGLPDAVHDRVSSRELGVAHIKTEPHTAGNAVHRAGKNVADADRSDGAGRARGARCGLNRQNQLRRGAQRVFAFGHQQRTRMTA